MTRKFRTEKKQLIDLITKAIGSLPIDEPESSNEWIDHYKARDHKFYKLVLAIIDYSMNNPEALDALRIMLATKKDSQDLLHHLESILKWELRDSIDGIEILHGTESRKLVEKMNAIHRIRQLQV